MPETMPLNLLKKIRDENPCLEGEKTVLELFSDKHLSETYIDWLNDPVVCQFNSHGSLRYTLEKAKAYLERIRNSENTIVFAICEKDNRKHIGNISINDISWNHHFGEISILIGEKGCWGKGFGTDAFKLAIDFGFKELKLHRLWIGMTTNNVGMIRIAERLGFRHEGILKEAFYKNGTYGDITQWAILNPNG